jgi:hypothetical protein
VAKAPKSVVVRSYQVGFGDCFLLSFVYGPKDSRHVLIDFGTTELPSRTGVKILPSAHMPRIADDIKTVCNGQLTAVVATHRHADHISGFATNGTSGGAGKIIAACKPKLVLQPWTEDPAAAKDAKKATTTSLRSSKGFVESLSAMHRVAERIIELVDSGRLKLSAAAEKQLRFLGMDNIANKSAVENLIAMGKAAGAKAVFAREGDASGFAGLLPGVTVKVLGPPDLTQTEKIKTMRRDDPDEFWKLTGNDGFQPLSKPRGKGNGRPIPSEARWFVDRLQNLSAGQLLEIVRTLDKEMNNTSLILLFEINGKKLLFPGDAQFENWNWALSDSPRSSDIRGWLANVDVYKVGHHGSRNATPRHMLWDGFKRRGTKKNQRLVSFVSTMPGKHSGVPRPSLMTALESETDLHNTMSLKWTKTPELCEPCEIPL